MNQPPFPTLKNIALYTVAGLLHKDSKACGEDLSNLITLRVSELELPVQLKDRLVATLSQLYAQIRSIKKRFYTLHDCTRKMFGDECCCSNGVPYFIHSGLPEEMVSERRTVCEFARDELRDARCRFIMACEEYLISDVLSVWEQLNETARHRFIESDAPVVVKFWARTIQSFKNFYPRVSCNYFAPTFILFVRKNLETFATRGVNLETVYPGVKFEYFTNLKIPR